MNSLGILAFSYGGHSVLPDVQATLETYLSRFLLLRLPWVAFATFLAVAFPFFGDLAGLSGAIGFTPMTFVFPFLLWERSEEALGVSSLCTLETSIDPEGEFVQAYHAHHGWCGLYVLRSLGLHGSFVLGRPRRLDVSVLQLKPWRGDARVSTRPAREEHHPGPGPTPAKAAGDDISQKSEEPPSWNVHERPEAAKAAVRDDISVLSTCAGSTSAGPSCSTNATSWPSAKVLDALRSVDSLKDPMTKGYALLESCEAAAPVELARNTGGAPDKVGQAAVEAVEAVVMSSQLLALSFCFGASLRELRKAQAPSWAAAICRRR
eukprot:g573.t1